MAMPGQEGHRAPGQLPEVDVVAGWTKGGLHRDRLGVGQEGIEAGTSEDGDVGARDRWRAGHAETLGEPRPDQVPFTALVDDPGAASGVWTTPANCAPNMLRVVLVDESRAAVAGVGIAVLPGGQLAAAEAPLEEEPLPALELAEEVVDPLAEVGPFEPPVVDVDPPPLLVLVPLADEPPLAPPLVALPLPLAPPFDRLLRESVR